MSQSTFSGPIRSGTVRDGTAATNNVAVLGGLNVGRPVLTQSYTIPFAGMLSAGSALTVFNLPAGSKILGISTEVTVALATATNLALQFGITGTVAKYFSSFNTGATIGKTAQSVPDAAMVSLQCDNIGTADVPILMTATAATGNASAGSVVVTISYVQRNADGT
jgi:hypothetical protein